MADNTLCGWWFCRPRWLQRFGGAKSFMWVYGLLGTTQAMAYVYLVATLTTMERRFKIPSSTTGLMMSGNEISQILLSLVLSYFGGRGNQPLWIAWGVAVTSFSCFILALPHFLYGPGSAALALTTEYGEAFNNSYLESSIKALTSPTCGIEFSQHAIELDEACSAEDENNSADGNYSMVPILLVFLSQFIFGIGTTLFMALGPIYLDDNTGKKQTPMLLGMTFSLRTMGTALGFILGYGCLSVYIDPFVTPVISKTDTRWLGAWWLGWIFLGIAIFVFAVLISLFPLRLPAEDDKKTSNHPSVDNELKIAQFKDFPKALKRILCNKLLMLSIMSATIYVLAASGYYTYSAKYMEVQYNQSAAGASVLAGASGLTAMSLGFLLSGIWISKFQPRPVIVLGWNVFTGICVVLLQISFVQLGCPSDIVQGTTLAPNSFSLNMECNAACDCPEDLSFKPVCINKTTFYSACHAGCTSHNTLSDSLQRNVTFSDCACAGEAFSNSNFSIPAEIDIGDIFATEGMCVPDCLRIFITFLVINSAMHMIGCSARIGNILVNFRCVDPIDKAFAQGLGLLLVSLIAFIPGPILFGSLIDASCLIWDESCGRKGNCVLYDKRSFSENMNYGAASITSVAVLLDIGVCYLGKDLDFYGEDEEDKK